MAVRNVSIKLAIDGEGEFRAAIQKINNELKVMNSALKLTEQEYKNNQNSMEALTAKHKALIDVQQKLQEKVKATADALKNAQDAQKRYLDIQNDLSSKLKAVNDALDKNAKAHDLTEDEVSKLTDEQQKLNEALQQNQKYLETSTRGVQIWEEKLNSAKTQLLKTNQELIKTDDYLDEAKKSTDNCATSIDKFGKEVKQAGDDSEKFGRSSKDAVDMLASALATAGIGIALREIRDAMLDCVQASMEFESAFAGVKKTVDATPEQFKVLADQIIDMSTRIPATTTEISAVAEAAGQLGIKTENIASFTEVMMMMGTSTNMSADEAATALAKLANIVQLPADQYQNLGSTVVDLGNNFATTEADIVHMMTRLAASGNLVGLSAADIAGFATALSSVGIEAEAGGSAVSKLFKKIETEVAMGGDKLEKYAKVAGMTADEFSAAWKTNAAGALTSFIEGLGKMEETGGNAIVTLNEMELNEIRLSNAMLSLANAGDLTRNAVTTANTAWKENTALIKEASQRYETTESKVQMAKNAFQNLKKTIGDEMNPAVQKLAEGGKDAMNVASKFLQDHPGIVTGLSAVVAGVGAFVGSLTLATAAIKVFNALSGVFAGVFSGPVGWIALAIGATAAIAALALTIKNEAVPSVEELTEKARALPEVLAESTAQYEEQKTNIEATADLARDYIERLKELEAQGTLTNEQQQEYADIVDRLRTLMPELNITIDEQTGLIQGGTDAILQQVDAWEKLSLQQAAQENLNAKQKAYNDAQVEYKENTIQLSNAKKQEAELEKKVTEARENLRVATSKLSAEQKDLWAWGGTDEQIAEVQALSNELANLEKQQRDNQATQENLTQAIDEGAKAVADAAGAMEVAKQAAKEFSDELQNAGNNTDEFAEKQAAVIGKIKESITTVASAYKDLYTAAKDSIQGQIGLFGEFKAEVDDSLNSVEKMKQRWEEQAKALQNYSSNLSKAAQYGIDEGLIAKMSDGSAQNAAYLDIIIKDIERIPEAGNKVVDELNKTYRKVGEATETAAHAVVMANPIIREALEEIAKMSGEVDFTEWKENLKKALDAEGLDFSAVEKALGGELEQAFNNAVGEGSPARQAANSAMEGYIGEIKAKAQEQAKQFSEVGTEMTTQTAQGLDANKGAVVQSVQSLGEEVKAIGTQGMTEAGVASAEGFGQGISGGGGLSAMASQEVNNMSANAGTWAAQARTVGEQIGEGMAQGLESKWERIASVASSMTANAMRQMEIVAAVKSPSRKAIEIFGYIGEGAAIGLKNKIKDVEDASKQLTTAALGQRIDNAMSNFGSKIQSVISPSMPIPALAGAGKSQSTEIYGGINVNVTPQNGESPEAFGTRTARQIRRELRDKGVNF